METHSGLTGRFGKRAKLVKNREFKRVMDGRRKLAAPDLLLWWRKGESPTEAARLGTSISRKLGGAVRRNRIKRLLREAFRLNRDRLREGMELVAYPRPGCQWQTRSDAENALLKLCSRAGLLKERR